MRPGLDAITIRGKELSRLVDALDSGALEKVRELSGNAEAFLENTIVIESLIIENPVHPLETAGRQSGLVP